MLLISPATTNARSSFTSTAPALAGLKSTMAQLPTPDKAWSWILRHPRRHPEIVLSSHQLVIMHCRIQVQPVLRVQIQQTLKTSLAIINRSPYSTPALLPRRVGSQGGGGDPGRTSTTAQQR